MRDEDVPGTDASSPDSSSTLLALLGTSVDDGAVERYVKSLGMRLKNKELKRFPPECVYVNHKSAGLSLCYESGVLDAIHVYAARVDGFLGFKGEVPWGVTLCDDESGDKQRTTGKSIVEKLGEPSAKGNTGGVVFLQYHALGVKFDLESSDWEHAEAKVRCVSLWKANAV